MELRFSGVGPSTFFLCVSCFSGCLSGVAWLYILILGAFLNSFKASSSHAPFSPPVYHSELHYRLLQNGERTTFYMLPRLVQCFTAFLFLSHLAYILQQSNVMLQITQYNYQGYTDTMYVLDSCTVSMLTRMHMKTNLCVLLEILSMGFLQPLLYLEQVLLLAQHCVIAHLALAQVQQARKVLLSISPF